MSSLTGVRAGYLCFGEFLHDDVIVFAKSHCHVTSGRKSLMDAADAGRLADARGSIDGTPDGPTPLARRSLALNQYKPK